MMRECGLSKWAVMAIAFGLCHAVLGLPDGLEGGGVMGERCLKNADYKSLGVAPFLSDIEEVERIWNESLPNDLLLVGGVDGFGWARVCRDDDAPPGIFYGEYRDRSQFYRGLFRYSHPEGAPMPENIYRDYYMSHYSPGEGVEVVPFLPDVAPIRGFFLVPISPHGMRYSGSHD